MAYNRNGDRFLGVQVKALSRRNPVPLGTSVENLMGDFWVVWSSVVTRPAAFIMRPDEVKSLAHRGEKDGRVSYWLQPGAYDRDVFRGAWKRIGRGDDR